MNRNPLHHIVRVRSSDDLTYVHDGLMDEVMINANQLENSIQSCAAKLWNTTLPFSVDPVLWRFQVPAWSENGKGDTKRNYKRLGKAYARNLDVVLGTVPIRDVVQTDEQWGGIAANVVTYQRERLRNVPTQLELLTDLRALQPARLTAPALVAFSTDEDRLNRVMADAATEAANEAVAVQVIIPLERLAEVSDLRRVLASIPQEGVSSYLVWTPMVTEAQLVSDSDLLTALIYVVASLADRGIAVGHQYSNYTVFALHDAGLSAATHTLGWVDHGEPAEERRLMTRSCRTYVPSLRHCIRFTEAKELGERLSAEEYRDRYCDCTFCMGAFGEGGHPFDVLLESQVVSIGGRNRLTPTSRSVGANTWHYLLARRAEVQAFSTVQASEVIRRDMERVSLLNRETDAIRLERLATVLRTA